MSEKTRTLRRIPQTTLRRLRNIPTYFFLIWRWTWWFFALAWILFSQQKPALPIVFLGITFIQSLVVTFYTPVFKIFLPELPWKKRNGASTPRQRNESRTKREWRNIWERNRVRPIAVDEEPEILPALMRSTNPYKDSAIYGLDVIICGLAMYFSAVYLSTPFGTESPFYRYGFATVLVAAFAYRSRAGLAVARCACLFVPLWFFFPPPGAHLPH